MMQMTIQSILAKLHYLDDQIHLKLPAPQQAVQQQRLHLEQIQQQLEALHTEVMERSRS
jgi:hypothetical protein